MTRSIVTMVAIIVAVVSCGGPAGPSGTGVATAPSPASTSGSPVSAAPRLSTDVAAAIPVDLQHVWLGPARDIPALGGPQALSIIRIRGEKFDYIFGAQGEEALNSAVAVSAEGQVRLTSANTTGSCQVGDEGVYDWTTTSDGTGLTMTKVTETCAPRADAVVGDWVRAACKDFGCLGDLHAGDHETAFFEPLGQPAGSTGSWRMQYGQLSYRVPDGWANAIDAPGFYNIVQHDAYAMPASNESTYPGISLVVDAAVSAQDDACSASVEPGVGRSSSEMAARIARIPSLQVGPRTTISVSGRSGTMFDLALRPGWDEFCPAGGGVPVTRENVDSADGMEWRMTTAGRWRLGLVDIAKGRTLSILIDSFGDPSRFDDLLAQAMPIVTSFELHPPTP